MPRWCPPAGGESALDPEDLRMKRVLVVAAAGALAAGAAFAQSSITIYGRANVSVEQQDRDGVKTTQLVNNASRLGLLGSEDLGGGLKAGFQLEHGFNIDTGTPTSTAFWGRQSEVNLGGQFGTVRLGRYTSDAYYATADYVSMHNHDTGTSADALYAYVGSDSNKVGYQAPELAKGLQLFAAWSIKESAPDDGYDLAAYYDVDALHLGAGYQKTGDAYQFALRALYDWGNFTFGGYLQWDQDAFGANFGNRTTYRLSGRYTMGASEFHLNYGHAGAYDNLADSSAGQFTIAYNYNLSKRTKVYAFYTKIDDSTAKVYGANFDSIAFGMRHNF
jgi:predicted porin